MVDNFPYNEYINDYPDLRHLNKEDAYNHWVNYGIDEDRKLNNYNYKEYLEYNVDIRHLNKKDAYFHWINNGLKEGRLARVNIINKTTNIVIIIHLFVTSLIDEFITYINNVKSVFSNVAIIFTIPEHSVFDVHIKSINPEFIVLKVQNKGVDVYPFLLSMNFLRKNNIKADFILKLHTKLTSNITENLVNWRKDLIEPITDKLNLICLQHYFKNIENLGYIGAQKCSLPKNYDLDFPSNIDGLNDLMEKFPYLLKDWTDFNGGNIFWINNKLLDIYLKDDLIEYIISNVSIGKPPSNLADKGIYIEYLCERLFTGVFCFDSLNILVSDYNHTQRGMGVTNGFVNHEYFNQHRVFYFSTPKEIIKYIKG